MQMHDSSKGAAPPASSLGAALRIPLPAFLESLGSSPSPIWPQQGSLRPAGGGPSYSLGSNLASSSTAPATVLWDRDDDRAF